MKPDFRFTIIFSLGIIWMVLGTLLHGGTKEYYITYFLLPAIFCPVFYISYSKSRFVTDLIYSTCLIFFFWLSAYIFWDYMDRPWFSPEPTYEGQYGWFSFENDLDSELFLFFGMISVVIGSSIKVARTMLSKIRH